MRWKVVLLVGMFVVAIAAQAEDPVKVVLASDEQTQIAVPQHWTDLELNDAAEIEVGNTKDEAYVAVLNESKEDLFGWNIDKHSRITLAKLLDSVAFPVVTGPKTLKVGDSPAIQYEIRGAVSGINILYIHTTVEGPKYFSQILAWTLPSRAETVRPQLLAAISTFRETK